MLLLERLDRRRRATVRRRLVPLVITLAAWMVAFVVVLVLLTVLGGPIAALPVALRALVLSGVVVVVMINLVMPVLSKTIMRWLADPGTGARDATRQLLKRSRHMNDNDNKRGSGPVDAPGRPTNPDARVRPRHVLARLWAAYPVHPPLTHLTIGAYGTATVLAVTGAFGVAEPDTAKGWWLSLVVGLVASIPTIASGLADFLALGRHHPARTAVVRHMLPALSTFPCFGAATVLGYPSYEDGVIAPGTLTLTLAGFVILTVAGIAGGRLVFTRGLRVKTK